MASPIQHQPFHYFTFINVRKVGHVFIGCTFLLMAIMLLSNSNMDSDGPNIIFREFIGLAGIGSLSVWSGLTVHERYASKVDLGLGCLLMANALAGAWYMASAGTASIGVPYLDTLLFEILATDAPLIHFLLSLFFFVSAYSVLRKEETTQQSSIS